MSLGLRGANPPVRGRLALQSKPVRGPAADRGVRPTFVGLRGLLSLAVASLFVPSLFADGGMVLQHVEKGPFAITIFATPAPIDLSVLVQDTKTLEPVLNANVLLTLTRGKSRVEVRAKHDRAQNKLLYAAPVRLEDPGEWHYTVSIGNVAVSGVLEVASEQPKLGAYWMYLALPFPVIAIFALHQWLRRQVHGAIAPSLLAPDATGLSPHVPTAACPRCP
jgi:hypothetical protein